MTYLIVAILTTLSDFEGHAAITDNQSEIFPTGMQHLTNISTDIVWHTFHLR